MKRNIIEIEKEKCNGCGLCAAACHEGAIALVNGKAELLREDYCDGLGDCLPACPMDAIRIVEREAVAYDAQAVAARQQQMKNAPDAPTGHIPHEGGCPGSRAKRLAVRSVRPPQADEMPSQLSQWPVQIQLVSPQASYFQGADLLIAADCTAFAHGDFHNRFIRGRITLIGCPKLDVVEYTEKLTDIFRGNDIRSLLVTRMEVPCCGGLERAVRTAIENSGKDIPLQVVVIATDGQIVG